jgi:hypothetical protein
MWHPQSLSYKTLKSFLCLGLSLVPQDTYRTDTLISVSYNKYLRSRLTAWNSTSCFMVKIMDKVLSKGEEDADTPKEAETRALKRLISSRNTCPQWGRVSSCPDTVHKGSSFPAHNGLA